MSKRSGPIAIGGGVMLVAAFAVEFLKSGADERNAPRESCVVMVTDAGRASRDALTLSECIQFSGPYALVWGGPEASIRPRDLTIVVEDASVKADAKRGAP